MILIKYFKIFCLVSFMASSISFCFAQVKPNSDAIDSQQQETFDPVIDGLMAGVVGNEEQLELITDEEQLNSDDNKINIVLMGQKVASSHLYKLRVS